MKNRKTETAGDLAPTSCYDFDVASDLYDTGARNEDGEKIVGEVFYVIATDSAGRRFVHNHSFLSLQRRATTDAERNDPYAPEFTFDVDRDAGAKAQALRDRIAAAEWIDSRYWAEGRPAYGSDAYVRGGWERELIEWEKEIDQRAA